MSAQVTEAHIARARASGYTTDKVVQMAAQFIANNEASKAERDQIRAGVERLTAACDKFSNDEIAQGHLKARAERAESELAKAKAILASIEEDGTEEHNAAVRLRQELATERARLDWLLSRMGGNVLPVNGCVAWTVDVYHYKNQFPSRAAIDAAMKEGAP